MDVEEVMGNIIDHLRAACKVSAPSQDNEVPDPIEAAFFSTFVDYRKKPEEQNWTRMERKERWATAFPAASEPKRALPLHDALRGTFDRDIADEKTISYTAIKDCAPHFHVYIQRADPVSGGKNRNGIIIPETLYLDRYMDTKDEATELFKLRKRAWDIKIRLNEISSNPSIQQSIQDTDNASAIVNKEPTVMSHSTAQTQQGADEPSQEELRSYT
jgi:ubiquitin carboxyl-terminal hydrolase 25